MNEENDKNTKKSKIEYINPYIEKKLNKKKIIIASVIGAILLISIILFIIYAYNEGFRRFVDEHLFFKNAKENNTVCIKADDIGTSNIFAYSNYIATMKENNITLYNAVGNTEATLKVEVTEPLIATSGDYLAVAEKNGKRLYLISKNNIVWQKDLEGSISRINVNSNGYVSIIVTGTSYKSVIALFNPTGEEQFKTYLSSTIAVDTDISSDNKYLAFAESNISGTLIQSNIKLISISKAKENPSDSVIYTYNANPGSLLINIKYQKNKLVCKFDDSIYLIDNNNAKKITGINENNQNDTFSDINLDGFVTKINEKKINLFNTNTAVKVINSFSSSENVYNLDGTVKNIYCSGDRIGLNLGSEIHFVDMNGWLVKKYVASQEIRKVAMGDRIVGIVYKDKIEILSL